MLIQFPMFHKMGSTSNPPTFFSAKNIGGDPDCLQKQKKLSQKKDFV